MNEDYSTVKESRITESGPVTLEQVLSLARQSPSLDKVRLIERIAPDIEHDIRQGQPLRSLLADRVRRSGAGSVGKRHR